MARPDRTGVRRLLAEPTLAEEAERTGRAYEARPRRSMTANPDIGAQIHVEMAPKLNFACHQSAFPLLRELRVENADSETPLDNVTVTLNADPSFLKPRTWQIDRISPGSSVTVTDRDIALDANTLLNLTDAMRGTVHIRVENDDAAVLAETARQVELLAYNEWGGAGYMPELLAAFALPNDPAVDGILREASQVLRRACKGDAIDGYQSGIRARVWEIAAAIYAAIANMGITYAVPPASFERDGQKIRLPGTIREGLVGTCLDTTMLFAAAFEQAGLNPVVVMPEGHALVGVWLQPEELSSIVSDDPETLRKRMQLQELLLIETTLVTSQPAPAFSRATAVGERQLDHTHDPQFRAAVDIRQARAHRISPLALTAAEPARAAPASSAEPASPPLDMEEAPDLPAFDEPNEDATPRTPEDRLERWQRKLLDLSARNPLLNHKTTKQSLPLLCPDPGTLEDKLADGARISLQPLRGPTDKGQDEALHYQRTGEVISETYAQEALDHNKVLVDLPEGELSKRAVEIYRRAQTSLQEGGANTLYLALGFLLWKREVKDTRRFRAPLILLPVALERKSVRSGIKIVKHDDEPRFNTTLLQMLRQDFGIEIGGLEDALPEDQSGVDVAGIWTKVRKAVKDAPGFEVVEDVVLGHFSFAKYLMWKDLVDRTQDLRQNSVVQHLIDTPREPYTSEISFVDGNEVDRHYKPHDLLAPLPADSSQMSAVATADRGKDFIVVGPPGTGKSQTIGNLIAHKLGKGETVLFVSEKTAALEVVYRRLTELGLDRFCLQLHSNKANKAEVLAQLRDAWDLSTELTEETWRTEADRLQRLRDSLNRVVDHLHHRYPNGLTAHDVIGVAVRDQALAARVSLSWPHAQVHDEAALRAMRETVERLEVQANAVGMVADSPLDVIHRGEWSPNWEQQVVARAQDVSRAASAVATAQRELCDALDIDLPDRTLARLESLGQLADLLAQSHGTESGFALEPEGQARIEALGEAASHLRAYAQAGAGLSCAYAREAWRHLDGDALARRWETANSRWWPRSFFARRGVVKAMRRGGAQGKPNPGQDAGPLATLRQHGEAIDRLDARLGGLRVWAKHDTDPAAAEDLARLGGDLRVAIGRLADDPQHIATVRERIRTLLRDGNDLLAPEAAVGGKALGLTHALAEFRQACADFDGLVEGDIRDWLGGSSDAPAAVRRTADAIAQRHHELHDWCNWRKRRRDALDDGLRPLVEAVESGNVPLDEISDTFWAGYCTWFSRQVIEEDAVLRGFSPPEHMAAIESFQDAVDRYQQLTAQMIAARLSGGLPTRDGVPRASQWGVLRHEIQKKARHKPVRQLVREIPEVLRELAPCLMMSPLSVAQYLPPDQAPFDVVIFDEASQIPVWDAVGAIARGRQTIVAGDPKQMPPTNFFNRSDDDPDGDVDVAGDLESILDEMLGASIPERRLNLHYRSRRESLIAFSNSRYYDNSLITFPAPVHPDHGVRLIRPEGHYARGKARHNQGEAKAIVNEIVRRLTSPEPAENGRSIGVVTFNAEQQTLIENLLDEARDSQPELEAAFSPDSAAEPVFVKNLETVQGDERDVILFSVTYGPDESGHVTMNFGPLNRQGGERRLNVAMTRARSEMLVFSTLGPDQIDLSRTSAKAVKDLKHFLEFAERGPAALGQAVHGPIGDFDSPFETAVARALRERGWEIHPQVGVSAFRIDLGIVNPDRPGVYLAGVECDGAKYHSTAFARERDKIRQAVLEGLGWTLERVWSTDWWINRAKALDALDNALRAHLAADREQRARDQNCPAEPATAAQSGQTPSATSGDEVEGTSQDEPATAHSRDPEPDSGSAATIEPVMRAPQPASNRGTGHVAAEPDASGHSGPTAYRTADLAGVGLKPDPEAFYDDAYDPRLQAMLDHVIDTEGPIHEEVLVRRIARHHGFKRAGRQIRQRVLDMARHRRGRTEEDVGIFFWPKGTVKDRAAPARYQGRDENELRDVANIAAEELRQIAQALNAGDDPHRVAYAIGLGRLGQRAHARLEAVLNAESR